MRVNSHIDLHFHCLENGHDLTRCHHVPLLYQDFPNVGVNRCLDWLDFWV